MNRNITECDDRNLKRLLVADEYAIEQDPWMQHLEQCSQCQSRLRELAADDEDWRKAAAVLGSDDDDLPCFTRDRVIPPGWNESMVKQLLEPPSHPEMLGRLGRYEMERMIGRGGMGIVFKAFDAELNRVVAVKMLAPYLAARGSARKRFAREARAAAGVRDDHVVPIFNVESEHEPPFLVMQYVAGGSLQEKLDRDGPLEVAEVLRIGLQIAKGLAAAHAQGLIHRDVKPANVLLDEGVERALLTDFGLARAEDDACLTRSGFHPGTPHYMSPEQVRGEAIDGRSDLFSLGCVLYALCTSHSPFRADTSYAVMRRITDETPRPICELNADIPEWFEAVVMKLLSKSRDHRFASADEVAALLEGSLAHVQEPTAKPLPAPVAELAKRFGPRVPRPIERLGGFRYPPIRKLLALATFAFFALASTILYLETGKGTIRIETNSEADVPIVIRQGDKTVEHLTVSKDGTSARLSTGNYVIEVQDENAGFVITGGEVRLTRGDTWVASITQVEHSVDSADPSQQSFMPWVRVEVDDADDQPSTPVQPAPSPASLNKGSAVSPPAESYAISDLVDRFNRQMDETANNDPQSPLTVDELLCFCRFKLEGDEELKPETKQLLTDVGIGRWLPREWTLEGGLKQAASQYADGGGSVYLIQFASRYSGTKVVIRKRYLKPPKRFQTPSLQRVDPGGIPLAAAVDEFNATNQLIDGRRQAPLTVDEVLAAIVDARFRRDEFHGDNATFANYQSVVDTHSLPDDAQLEVLPNFVSQSGDTFKVWSIRLVMPQANKPEWTHAFEIRRHCVSVNSQDAAVIHWGIPNKAGLQAGFRLVPSQRRYQVGASIKTEFFYRSIYGKPIHASLPNLFSHQKLIAKDADGNLLDVVESRSHSIAGAIETEVTEHPLRRQGPPLQLGYITPIPEYDFMQNHPAETNLTVKDGQTIFLQYVLSDFAGGELSTGELKIEIATRYAASEMAQPDKHGSEPLFGREGTQGRRASAAHAPVHETIDGGLPAYDAYHAAVQELRTHPHSDAKSQAHYREWLPRLLDALEKTDEPADQYRLALSALGLANSLKKYEVSEVLARRLIALSRSPEESARWREELGGILENQRLVKEERFEWGDFLEVLPEVGTVLVMLGTDSDISKQMEPIAKTVAETAGITLIEQPQVRWRQITSPSAAHFVLIKDRQLVGVRTGLLTKKRLAEFVELAEHWLTPHSAGVDPRSLVRIDCYINPGNDHIGSQHGAAYPLTTAVVAVHEDQALLLGPDSVAGYMDKGYACVAVVRDETGKSKQLPLDIVQVGPVKLMGQDKHGFKPAATATVSLGDGQSQEIPIEIPGYPEVITQKLDAYDTGSAVYQIRGVHGVSPVKLAPVDDLPQVEEAVLSGGFNRESHRPPLIRFTPAIDWQSQTVDKVGSSIYGGNRNGPELIDVLCPTRPAPCGFTFNSRGLLIGRYALGQPTDDDMTHTVFQPDTTHSILLAALAKIDEGELKSKLRQQVQKQVDSSGRD